MTTSNTEESDAVTATATAEQPKPTKMARVAPRRTHVAPRKAKSADTA